MAKFFSAIIVFALCLAPQTAIAQFYVDQLNVNQNASIGKGSPAAASAVLDVVSITQGALLPRMTTTQRLAISSPATGLLVYDTTLSLLYQYTGSAWAGVGSQGNLMGDVSSVGLTTTVEAIQGVVVSGTTGTGNVVFSSAPTFTSPPNLSSLTASLPLQLDSSKNMTAATVQLSTQVGGTLAVGHGGTGQGSNFTQYGACYAPTAVTLGTTAAGAANSVFIGNGSAAPSFSTVTSLLDSVFSSTQGSVLYRGASTWSALGPGTSGNVLTTGGSAANPSWAPAGTSSPLTTKGDSYTYSTTNARQAVPGDNGRLVPDSTQTNGWRSASYTTYLNGRPGKNYIQYADFENASTTGWTLGTIGTLTNGLPTGSPTFGSGASGNLSLAVEGGLPLAGVDSLGYVSSAATTAGNMVASSSYAIDASDQAKVLTVKFYYWADTNPGNSNWSGTSSNSFAWALYDVTNSSWLSSAGNFCMTQSSGVGYCTGTAQTNATTANIRLVVYNANATSGGTTLFFDDFYVGPQTAPMGPAMTDWVQYTPTFVGFGTVSSVNVYSRRHGDTLEVRGTFASGTVTGTANSMTIGYNGANGNVSIDTTKVTAGALVGKMGQSGSATTYFTQSVLSTSGTTVNFGSQNSTTSELSAGTGQIVGNGATASFFFAVPIVGWSSNTSMSSDTDTRVISARVYKASNATLAPNNSSVLIPFDTATFDNAGAFSSSGNRYVIQVSGVYTITAKIVLVSTNVLANEYSIELWKNGSFYEQGNAVTPVVGTSFDLNATFPDVNTVAGDYWQIYLNGAGNNSSSTLTAVGTAPYTSSSFARRSGPAVITATESVNARYHSATATITSSASVVTYSTKDFDSHNAYASGTYTVPVSGKYQINASLVFNAASHTTGNNTALFIYKNGSAFTNNNPGTPATQFLQDSVSDIVPCLAGDTITIQALDSISGSAVAASTAQNYFSITRVGN